MTKNNCLESLIETATPIDPSAHSKELFLEIIRRNPQLENSFREKCTELFLEQIKEKGVYFITNYVTRKPLFRGNPPTIRLSFCGMDELPTISLDF